MRAWIGIGGLRTVDWKTKVGEMGIILDTRYQRQGLCLEMHLSCLKHAFEVLGHSEVFFMTLEANIPMRCFYRKYGIPFVGLREGPLAPKRDKVTGKYLEGEQEKVTFAKYRILAEQWSGVKAKMMMI